MWRFPGVIGGVASLGLALAACTPPPRATTTADAGADASLCGNGVVDPNPRSLPEECDEGALNGTPESLCSKQCWSGQATLGGVAGTVQLGSESHLAVTVRLGEGVTTGWGVAYTAFDDSGIHVIRDMLESYFLGATPSVVDLKVAAAPIALGAVGVEGIGLVPIWIEAPPANTPVQSMYWAEVDPAGHSTIHTIAYPFPDGTAPRLVTSSDNGRGSLVVLDQSRDPPYDLLVAVMVLQAPDHVVTKTLRLPAPGRVRGAAVEAVASDLVTGVDKVEQVVQFFDDTATFVAIEDTEPPDGNDFGEAYELHEAARGSWPFHVADGLIWDEDCHDGPPDPTFTHPTPLQVITDTGDIYVWQFSEGLQGEAFVTPFGHVMPGTLPIRGVVGPLNGFFGLEPDGEEVYIADSSCGDLRSTGLRRQQAPATEPWAHASRISKTRGMAVADSQLFDF